MHIGIDARLTYYRRGGISLYIERLTAGLESLDTAHRFTFFYSRKADHPVVRGRIRHAQLWTPCHHRLERIALSAELIPHRLDLFHTTDFIPPLRGANHHVISVHDLAFLHYPRFLTDESRRYYADQIVYAVDHADHILTISEASKQDIIAMLGVSPDKITVHLLAADESFKPLTSAAAAAGRSALELPETYFLFVGTFEPRKNILGLACAYKRLIDAQPGAPPLVLAGTAGWNFEETQRAVDALQLPDRILWRYGIPQEALPALYGGAVALLMPSFYEGFGLPALEAMACGTMPIVSDRSALPEVVGDVGVLVHPEDEAAIAEAMRRAWQDSAWRTEQERKGLERARIFTWDQVTRTALSAYEMFA
ncbi:MAG: glycosyltransferase family 4 protein [Anaerolineae bacterium]|nr:glycosyltransferase family 4 protein [Anaerolineae bacterium]NUQ02283.1 glycosyltransferase family 4 protein [Anaerolineae bacterium]